MKLWHSIDSFLNSYTMYRVVLYGLSILAVISISFGFLELLPFTGMQLLQLLILILGSCYLSHLLAAKIFGAITNSESYLITALILFFILAPIAYTQDIWVTIAAGVIAMFSRYLLAIDKKHIFNPAAIAVLILGLLGFGNGIWWIGSTVLLPFTAVIGFLVVRKIRHWYLFWPFVITALTMITGLNLLRGVSIIVSLQQAVTSWPLIFFGTIMLTEPLTAPPRKQLSIIYSAVVGILFGSQFSFGPVHSSPELALVLGNLFAYFTSPPVKLVLTFISKKKLGSDLYEFNFVPNHFFAYQPGQYMEWTIGPEHADARGNRRYFTIASAPTEKEVKLGVKIGSNHSSFKEQLLQLESGETIMASQLAGDFVLPADPKQKLVLIAGGIGVTPFRSMAKYLTDNKEQRDIVLFYACSNADEFVYQDIFSAAQAVGIKTVYVVTHADEAPKNWSGEVGRIDEQMLKKYVPDLLKRTYYISGPNVMVESYKQLLHKSNVPAQQIITDYFPGF